MAITIRKTPCPDTTLQVNGVTEGTHVAGSMIGINLSDGTNPVTPDSVTKVGDDYEVVVTFNDSDLFATGQTNDYGVVGSDGNLQIGANPLALPRPNYFGNTRRFNGITGGHHNGTNYVDVDGNTTTRALAFPENIAIDMRSRKSNGNYIGYAFMNSIVNSNFDTAIANALSFSTASFPSGWFAANEKQLENIKIRIDQPNNLVFNYPPFDNNSFGLYWTNTQTSATNAIRIGNVAGISADIAKTATSLFPIACRIFHESEL